MALQSINLGATGTGAGGDTARTAFEKLNANFSNPAHASSKMVIGPVSQSGGVPTGAIIERGSNANGEYVRFADGTQECWGSGTGSPNASDANAFGTTSGTTFYENVQVTLPAAFINTSYVMQSAATARGVASLCSPTTTSTAFVQCRHAGQGVSVPFRYTAKGRWF